MSGETDVAVFYPIDPQLLEVALDELDWRVISVSSAADRVAGTQQNGGISVASRGSYDLL